VLTDGAFDLTSQQRRSALSALHGRVTGTRTLEASVVSWKSGALDSAFLGATFLRTVGGTAGYVGELIGAVLLS
jgi:hypothetical protein